MMVVVCVVLLANAASAAIITARAEGVVNSVEFYGDFQLDGSVNVGTPMETIFVYDTDTPAFDTTSSTANYYLLSASMRIGNYTVTPHFDDAEPAYFFISTANQQITLGINEPYIEGTIYDNGVPKTFDDFDRVSDSVYFDVLYGTTNPAFTDELPTVFQDISLATRKNFNVYMQSWAGSSSNPIISSFDIHGELTSLEIVPEPATMMMFGLGGLLLRKRK